jgi:hypothetical protein
LAQDETGVQAELAARTQRARPVLTALLAGVEPDASLVVAVAESGFPVAQRLVRVSAELPAAVVVGRHGRSDLVIADDPQISLRHLLLVTQGRGELRRYRAYDLRGRAGLVLPDGRQVSGASFLTQGLLRLGRTALYVLPGGVPGAALASATPEEFFARVAGSPGGAGHYATSNEEPGVAWLPPEGEAGGYRGAGLERPEARGILRLRAARSTDGGARTRELEVDSQQLRRGLLIGRYSDRCSLAGGGRNLSRVHALVAEEGPSSLLVYDLASTNGVRPAADPDGPSHSVVRLTPDEPVFLGHFELSWQPPLRRELH